MTSRIARCCILAASIAAISSTCREVRASISFAFSGKLTEVQAPLAGTFSVGQTVSGSFTFDELTPPLAGSNSGVAQFDLAALDFSIGAYSAFSAASPAGRIVIQNNPGGISIDAIDVKTDTTYGLTGPAVGGLGLHEFDLGLDESTGNVISDALIPPTTISLADFTPGQIRIGFGFAGNQFGIRTSLDTLTPQDQNGGVVPEANSLVVWFLLGGVGCVGSVIRLRR